MEDGTFDDETYHIRKIIQNNITLKIAYKKKSTSDINKKSCSNINKKI